MLDLMQIAKTEADGGDLFGLLSSLFEAGDIKPDGYPDAVIWKGGNHDGNINPVAHSLTDAYALLGTIAAIDILGLPYYAVPMWSQYRHDMKLEPLTDYSKFKATYDLEHGVSDNFYTQTNMDRLFKIDSLNHKNKIFVVSLKKRIEHLTLLTTQIGAQPIFINQVLNDGQLSEKMYLTNYIIREYCLENDLKFIDLAKDIILNKHDFYDEFHTTPSGSKKIAEYIYPHLKNYLE